MKYVKLNNGVEMPILGFGVYQIPKEETKRCVLDAIKVGFRAIDTAQSYFNEEEVGEAITECGYLEKNYLLRLRFGLIIMGMIIVRSQWRSH